MVSFVMSVYTARGYRHRGIFVCPYPSSKWVTDMAGARVVGMTVKRRKTLIKKHRHDGLVRLGRQLT